eukprot:10460686-Lingulodinium_polyedra.AAC.1
MTTARAALRVPRVLPKTAAFRTRLRAFDTRPLCLGRRRWRAGPRSMPRSATTPGVSMRMPRSARSSAMSRASAGGLVKMPDLLAT